MPVNFRDMPTEKQNSPARTSTLRPRTVRQSMPYTVSNMERKFDSKGLKVSESELEEAVNAAAVTSSPSVQSISKNKKRRKNFATSIEASEQWLVQSGVNSRSTSSRLSNEETLCKVTFRTRLRGFGHGTIPINAQSCPSNESFFATIKRKWAFELDQKQIKYCVVMFPWLDNGKNILLQEDDSGEFAYVLKEIEDAPGWSSEDRVQVTIEIHTE